jgi:hypothetical protein
MLIIAFSSLKNNWQDLHVFIHTQRWAVEEVSLPSPQGENYSFVNSYLTVGDLPASFICGY